MLNGISLESYDQKQSFFYFLAFLQNKIDKEGHRQVDIARAIDVRPEYINRVYKERQRCSVDVQEKISQYFGVSYLEALALGKQIKEPGQPAGNTAELSGSLSLASSSQNRRKTDHISASDIVSAVSQWAVREKETEEELARLQNIIENLSEGLVLLDTDLTITYQNRSHRSMFGAALEGETCHSAHGCEQHICECPSVVAKRTGMPAKATFPYATGVVSALTTPIRNFNGEVTGYVTVLRDITEREKLKIMTEQALELTGNAVIIYDEHLNIRFYNSNFKEMTDASDEHLLTLDSFLTYLKQNKIFKNENVIEMINTASEDRREVNATIEFANGKTYLYNAKPLLAHGKNYIGRIGIFTPFQENNHV